MADRPITRSMSSELQGRHQQQFHGPYSKGVSDLFNEAAGASLFNAPEASQVLRNTSEEMFIKSIVEDNVGAPNMEGMGFPTLPNATRADSEELFHSWMSHGEGQTSLQAQASQRPRQASRRMSNELAGILGQQSGQSFNKADSFDHFLQSNLFVSDDLAAGKHALVSYSRDNEEIGASASKPPSQKHMSWFSQPHPVTRSRSSELRRRYAAMQGRPPPAESTYKARRAPAPADIQLMASSNKRANQPPSFPQHVNQASGPSYPLPISGPGDSVSNFVSLLKGTIERKKVAYAGQSQQQQQVLDPFASQQPFEELQSSRVDDPMFQGMGQIQQEGSPYQGMGHMQQEGSPYHTSSSLHLGGMGHMQQEGYGQVQSMGRIKSEGPSQLENFNTANNNTNHAGPLSHVPSPSESSAGGPGLSREDPCNSGHMKPLRMQSMDSDIQQSPKLQNSINGPIGLGSSECAGDGVPKSKLLKKSQLTQVGSFSSSHGSGLGLEKEDPTKKRRVERQRKMAEAKGRGSVPMLSCDLQAALKRCATLEKEVRSLKLNLSFMNRKDSEQTKQIEELQKQNESLQEEKERLLEEIAQLSAGAYLA